MLPKDSKKSDWEVELGVVIGSTARYVEENEALEYVAGYVVVNDLSEREYQIERGGTWDKGKGCDTFGPVGPWLVTRDEVGEVQADGQELACAGDRHPEARRSVHGRQTGRVECSKACKALRCEVRRRQIGNDPGERAERALGVEHPRLFVAGGAVAQQFHGGSMDLFWIDLRFLKMGRPVALSAGTAGAAAACGSARRQNPAWRAASAGR
jgi:hypothetical protein